MSLRHLWASSLASRARCVLAREANRSELVAWHGGPAAAFDEAQVEEAAGVEVPAEAADAALGPLLMPGLELSLLSQPTAPLPPPRPLQLAAPQGKQQQTTPVPLWTLPLPLPPIAQWQQLPRRQLSSRSPHLRHFRHEVLTGMGKQISLARATHLA